MADEGTLLDTEQVQDDENLDIGSNDDQGDNTEPDEGGEESIDDLRARIAEFEKRLADKDRHITRVEQEAADARAKVEAATKAIQPAQTEPEATPEFSTRDQAWIAERKAELVFSQYLDDDTAQAKAEKERRSFKEDLAEAEERGAKRVLSQVSPLLETATKTTLAEEVANVLASDVEVADIPASAILRDISAYNKQYGAGAWQALPEAARREGYINRARELVALRAELTGQPAPTRTEPKPEPQGEPPKPPIPAATPPASPNGATAPAGRSNPARDAAAEHYATIFPHLRGEDGKPVQAAYDVVDDNKRTTNKYMG